MDVILDVGEIGWACYHRAHLWWRYNQGEQPPKVQLWTLPERLEFYEPFIYSELKQVSKEFQGNRYRNCFKCARLNEQAARRMGIEWSSIIHAFNCKRPPSGYGGKMLFKPYKTPDKKLSIDRTRKSIVVFPRYKGDMRRNWSPKHWNALLQLISDQLNYNIILCGLKYLSYNIDIQSDKIVSLIGNSPFLDTILALNDPQTILCVTSQSFGGKLSLLQNVHTLMWGHQQKRHQVEENWSSDPKTICEFIDSRSYDIGPQEVFKHIKQFLRKIDQ